MRGFGDFSSPRTRHRDDPVRSREVVMGRVLSGRRIAKHFCLFGLMGAFLLLAAVAVFGQETKGRGGGSEAGGPFPRLPGALTRAPEGLGTDTQFDVEKSFTTLPRERNAAPL